MSRLRQKFPPTGLYRVYFSCPPAYEGYKSECFQGRKLRVRRDGVLGFGISVKRNISGQPAKNELVNIKICKRTGRGFHFEHPPVQYMAVSPSYATPLLWREARPKLAEA